VLEELAAHGLLELRGGQWRTTRRWQAAMARAAFSLLCSGGDGEDLRPPIIAALLEIYGNEAPADRLASYVEVMLPIEARELCPTPYL
jgi:hypothetical protein